MNFVIIIQARMGSKRFPGKSFYPINGIPSLQHLIDSLLTKFSKDQIIIATSDKVENDPIRDYGIQQGISTFSGNEENVASRFFEIAKNNAVDYLIRLNGDSPLFCAQELHKFLTEKMLKEKYDLLSTAINRNFPKGSNFEIINRETFIHKYPSFKSNDHFEHVTSYFYENKELFKLKRIAFSMEGCGDINLCFDTQEDLLRLNLLFKQFNKPHYQYTLEEKCYIYRSILNKC